MVRAGMNLARLNFSHGTPDEHMDRMNIVRVASKAIGKPVAILQDLPGPKLRVGRLKGDVATLKSGSFFTLTSRDTEGDSSMAFVNYPDLSSEVRVGDAIYLADGSISLRVAAVTGNEVTCRVVVGGQLLSGKGVNIPDRPLRVPALTERDTKHLNFGLDNDVDAVAVSFVRTAEDVKRPKDIIRRKGSKAMVVAKIEKKDGVRNIKGIVEEADGIMVARGDLGVEMALERVPLVQKDVIRACNLAGKPVITATQMLESMVENPFPTRAEVADVANAVFDGTDAVMLSEETAVGKHPVEAVRVLSRVAREAEKALPYQETMRRRRALLHPVQEDAISLSASELAFDIGAVAVVAPTRTGSTARRISKFRGPQPIIALTENETVMRQLGLSWGVHPVLWKGLERPSEIFRNAERAVLDLKLGKIGDRIVVVAGDPSGPLGRTDMVKVQVLGESTPKTLKS
jgi:pyruvate kinase